MRRWLPILLLLLGFGWGIWGLAEQSFWYDEAWTAWTVTEPSPLTTIQRVAADVHPPLYFLLLDGWEALTGDSEWTLRLFSVFAALPGATLTYQLGKRWGNRTVGVVAMGLLLPAGFLHYFQQETRMYTLLMSLSAASMLAFDQWRHQPTRRHTLLYSLSLLVLLYTHYNSLWLILTQGIFLIGSEAATLKAHLDVSDNKFKTTTPKSVKSAQSLTKSYSFAIVLVAVGFLPWLPTAYNQLTVHPNGPALLPIATNWGTVGLLINAVTQGRWLIIIVPFLLGIWVWRGWRSHLLLLWLTITPAVMLLINLHLSHFYQERYVIGVLPAGCLLISAGLTHLRWRPIILTWLAVWVVFQITDYTNFWLPKANWHDTIATMLATRQPDEATISFIVPFGVEGYYDRRWGIADEQTIVLEPVWQEPAGFLPQLAALPPQQPIWLIMPTNAQPTWDTLGYLAQNRTPGYRSHINHLLLYRFDPTNQPTDLQFQFGDQLHYTGRFPHDYQITPPATLCIPLHFTASQPQTDQFSIGLHLLDRTGRSVAQWDGGIGYAKEGEPITREGCVTIPAGFPPDLYHLQLTVYNWQTGDHLPLYEGPADNRHQWGNTLILGTITINN